jgi:oxygen-independent coproporphyrinogen-3 oxidase
MNDGVDLQGWKARVPDLPWETVEETLHGLEAAGRLKTAGGVVRLTSAGRLIADAIGAEIMAAFATEAALA